MDEVLTLDVKPILKEVYAGKDSKRAKRKALQSLAHGKKKGKQLKMGIKEEKEHTSNPLIAEKIASDHLKETKDYYTRLKKAGL